MAELYVIGTGMGDGVISETAHELISKADVLVGGERLLTRLSHLKGRRVTIKGPLEEMLQKIRQLVEIEERVVVLADGDPLFFGIGERLLKVFETHELQFFPNVTALQAASAEIGLPWERVKTVSVHGRRDIWPLLRAISFHDLVGVYTGGEDGPKVIARVLKSKGANSFQLIVFENLGYRDQRIREFSIDEVEEQSFHPLNFVLLKRIRIPIVPLRLGIDDEKYIHKAGLITKREVRAVALSRLDVFDTNTVWDLGAGCGSVAIEVAYLAREGMVFAVERQKSRTMMIRKNIERTGAFHVEVIHGFMPECLESLPDPDRVFVGGGLSGNSATVLEEAARRLKPGGRMVVPTVLMSSLEKCLSLFQRLGWQHDMVQVQISRSAALLGSVRLDALNPVFVIAGHKPI